MIKSKPVKYAAFLPALCLAAAFPASPAAATGPGSKQVVINLSSSLRPVDLALRGGDRTLETCRHLGNSTSGGILSAVMTFGLNLLVEEIMQAINSARLAHLASLTDSFAGARNFVDVTFTGSSDPSSAGDCLVVDQIERTEEGPKVRSSFIFKIRSYGPTAIALKPLTAQVNETTANANVGRRGSKSVNAQVAIAIDALVGGNCAADERNCAPAERVTLGAPQFAFRNIEPTVPLQCFSETDAGCGQMSGESPAFPVASANIPISVGTAVTLTSVTLSDAKLRQEMWERHRAALLDLLKSAIPDLES